MNCLYQYLTKKQSVTVDFSDLYVDQELGNAVNNFGISSRFSFEKSEDIYFNIISTSAFEDISKSHTINILTIGFNKISMYQHDTRFFTDPRYYFFFKQDNTIYAFVLGQETYCIYFYHDSMWNRLNINVPLSDLEREVAGKIYHLFTNPLYVTRNDILKIMLQNPIEVPFDFPDFEGKIPNMFNQKDSNVVGVQYVDIEPEVV